MPLFPVRFALIVLGWAGGFGAGAPMAGRAGEDSRGAAEDDSRPAPAITHPVLKKIEAHYYWKRPLTDDEKETVALFAAGKFVTLSPNPNTMSIDASSRLIAVPQKDGTVRFSYFEDERDAERRDAAQYAFAMALYTAARALNNRDLETLPDGWVKATLPPPFAPPM